MLILVTGGSGSGKSAFAEAYIDSLSGECPKYYIATMQVYDQEGQRKVQRHRRMRKEKRFLTIEQPTEIEQVLHQLKEENNGSQTALLECMSNLVANEMFQAGEPKGCELVTEKIIRGIDRLNESFKHLVIVTNNVFEDGIAYDETTMEYIRALGSINESLASMADKVIEVVVGIPVIVKGK